MADRSNLENLMFNRISSVDTPAVEDAESVIMKRRDPVKKDHMAEILTSVEEGHQHGISIESWDGKIHLYISQAKAQGEGDYGHSHSIIVQDSQYMLAMNAGHTHTVEQDALQTAMLTRAGINKEDDEQPVTKDEPEAAEPVQDDVDKQIPEGAQVSSFTIEDLMSAIKDVQTTGSESGQVEKTDTVSESVEDSQTTQEQIPMAETPPIEIQDDIGEVVKLKDELEYTRAVVELEKGHRDFYDALPVDERRSFAKMIRSDRERRILASREADPVVYRTDDGIEIRKSAGETVTALAKSNDEARRENRELRDAREHDVLEKRADNELRHLSGELETRVALLKAIDGIEDENIRGQVMATVKSNDAGVSAVFKTYGHRGSASNDDDSAEEKLNKFVKKMAADKGITYAKAYTQAKDTEEGRELYRESTYN